jgi:transcriptional activator HAC1
MASWEQQTSPLVKFENSPAESFLSVPGDAYPSLFAVVQTPGSTGTMNPLEIMTPKSFADDGADAHVLASLAMAHSPSEDCEGTPEPDKKQTKKRKSWGQVLPEPKTNLPPRKRAKTEDEKEQRRVERVLRNRRAAQSSRERKRLEVEALERLNKDLQDQLLRSKQANELLLHELNNLRRSTGVAPHSSSAVVTLSQQLFASHGAPSALSLDAAKSSLINELMPSATVNPASLSPELAPVADSDPIEEGGDDDDDDDVVAAANSAENSQMDAATASASLDLTQRPAEMLCDLQCHMSMEAPPRSRPASQSPEATAATATTLIFMAQLQLALTTISAMSSICQRPLTQIAMSLRAGFSVRPTRSILTTIIWLVTLPPSLRRAASSPSTLPTSSTTTSTPPLRTPRSTAARQDSQRLTATKPTSSASPTLRLRFLRKILTCSPMLARPLSDATMGFLRLVSEGCEDRVEGPSNGFGATARDDAGTTSGPSDSSTWIYGTPLPSREVLLTLLWAIRVHEMRQARRSREESVTIKVADPEAVLSKLESRISDEPAGYKSSSVL